MNVIPLISCCFFFWGGGSGRGGTGDSSYKLCNKLSLISVLKSWGRGLGNIGLGDSSHKLCNKLSLISVLKSWGRGLGNIGLGDSSHNFWNKISLISCCNKLEISPVPWFITLKFGNKISLIGSFGLCGGGVGVILPLNYFKNPSMKTLNALRNKLKHLRRDGGGVKLTREFFFI